MRIYLLPYVDILAWCLMPNHFHFMVLVNETTVGVAHSDADGSGLKMRTLNDSIGIMLRSYTNAINKKYNRSGKLIREKTKAECITCSDGITPSFYNTSSGTQINIIDPVKQYPELCFHYIHQNPVSAGLAKSVCDWEFSSARDYAGLRNGRLVNKEVARQYIIETNFD
ncbi:MAG: transposase [Tangfeifania sp.]